ncbi:substrate-binding domain-containing protein [Lutibaculum baratangense]|uniref:Solute-binding protein family 3/N-terminal domain-containing protein n=1 Tax=Lutibaculum baratangense AMV1 TaxID=631454 RepID=V4R1D4_9HYPH|nr:substrate-binding domain-containing protein [Lutibaculum baratangense]ESR25797.1 hypothetical protein N177_1132 [Lutibaculum baratangense AMV1]
MRAWAKQTGRALARLAVAATVIGGAASTAGAAGPGAEFELVDPNVLRVCADPRNMPFSNEAGEGFENKLAELIARKLGKGLSYTYFPQGLGFLRNTLDAVRCDVVMGYAQGEELVQNTNAYYRSAYVIAVPADSELAGVTALSDPRLKGKKIGVVAQTPPATALARNGLMGRAKPYYLMVDTRISAPVRDMFADLEGGQIDAAVAWGPMAGYYAKESGREITVIPLMHEDPNPRMSFRITMGVRHSDQEWKRTLNRLIRESQDEINQILLDYGVPLIDEQGNQITQAGE